ALFRGHDADEVYTQLLLRDLAEEFTGMLRWAYLLRIRVEDPGAKSADAVGWHVALIQELARDVKPRERAATIHMWAGIVERQFQQHGSQVAALVQQTVERPDYTVRYFVTFNEARRDPWLSLQTEKVQRQAVARLDFWVTDQPAREGRVNPQT